MIESGEHEACDDNNVDYSEMSQQCKRLSTYLSMYNHVFTKFSPIELAKNGLFYNERYSVIICFSCRKKTPTKIQVILCGPVYKKSNFHLQECKLEGNKPLQVPRADVYNLIQIHLHQEYCAEVFLLPSTTNDPPLTTLPTETLTPSPSKHPSSQKLSIYDSDEKRLETFSNWPASFPVDALAIAKAGFIFLGDGDKVQCVYCRIILSQWEPGDDPIEEHFRHSSSCQFILPLKRNNKAYLTGTAKPLEVADSCTNRLNRNTNTPPNVRGSKNTNSSTNSNYNTISTRLQTFNNWTHPTLTAYELSLAGFYLNDQTKLCTCFLCHISIDNWKTGDDPFKVHALKSPGCSYILQLKGKQFITDSIKTSHKTELVGRESAIVSKQSENILEALSLLDDTDALRDENEKLRDEKMCIVCTTEPKTTLILPCAHLVCCAKCVSSLQNCPVCRAKIRGTVKTFLP